MKKRPFILIEVLIAFTLAAICAIPLIRQPIHLYRKEIRHLEALEKERLADLSFLEIKEMFLHNKIAWKQLPAKGEWSQSISMANIELSLPGRKRELKRFFTIRGKSDKASTKGILYKQLEVHLNLDGEIYRFRFPVQKISD